MGGCPFSGTDNGHNAPCDVVIGFRITSSFKGSLIRFTLANAVLFSSQLEMRWSQRKYRYKDSQAYI